MHNATFLHDHPVSPDAPPDDRVSDLSTYRVDTSVDELCHLLARIVARAAAENEQAATLQEEAA